MPSECHQRAIRVPSECHPIAIRVPFDCHPTARLSRLDFRPQLWGQTCDAVVAPDAPASASLPTSDTAGSDDDATPATAPTAEGILTLFQLLSGSLAFFVILQVMTSRAPPDRLPSASRLPPVYFPMTSR